MPSNGRNNPGGFTILEVMISSIIISILFLATVNVMGALTDSMDSTRNSLKAVGINKIILDQINEQLLQSELENTSSTSKIILFGTPVSVPNVVVGKDRFGFSITRTVSMYPGLRFYLPDPNNPVNLLTGFTNWDTRSIEYQYDPVKKNVIYTDNRVGIARTERIGVNVSFFGAYQIFEPLNGLFHITVVCTTSFGIPNSHPPTQRNIQNQISIRPLN
jgi:prepilin-type N-terminal cleavage/methylation domain-containing protein